MAHPTLTPGTRVRCTYRNDPGFQHVGTLLADDDPRGWVGSLAFPQGTPSVEAVRAHVENVRAAWPERKGYPSHDEYRATRAVVAWDFGKVYDESAEAIFAADAPRGWDVAETSHD